MEVEKKLEEQMIREVLLLKDFDPDEELKADFESVSLQDLQKYLKDQDAL